MQPKTVTPKKHRSLLAKIGRVTGIVLLSLVGLVLILLLLIQTAPVQNFARKKAVVFLENKLKTKVEIGRIDIDFPKKLVLENIYIEDRQKDTLVAGHQLKVDIDMWKLLSSEIQINEINLNGVTTKIKRQLPDTTFNFQFIVDAFVPATTTPKATPADTSALKMAIEKIIVDKTKLVYIDVVTGNDMNVYINHFDTDIKTFDPDNLKFEIPTINLDGFTGTLSQMKPLQIQAVTTEPTAEVPTTKPKFLQLVSNEVLLKNIDVAYNNEQSNLETRFIVDKLNVFPGNIDLEKTNVVIDKIEMNKLDGFVKLGHSDSKIVTLTNQNNEELPAEALPWTVRVNEINLDDNKFRFDDESAARLSRGMDYGHLEMTDLDLHVKDFVFNVDSIAGEITEGRMKERSGFVLNTLQTKFLYGSQGGHLKDLLLQTPGTTLKRAAIVRWPSLEAIQKNVDLVEMDVDIADSRIAVRDILLFAPQMASQPAFKNRNATLFVDSRIRGSVSRLMIDNFNMSGLGNTRVDLSGSIFGLPDANNLSADLTIRNLSSSRSDVQSFMPPNTLPSNITLPEAFNLSGTIKGGTARLTTNLALNTSLGSAKLNGTFANVTNPKTAVYNATVSTSNLNLGAIMQQQETMGKLTANFRVRGSGFDPKTVNAVISGNVISADFNKYNYKNLALDATYKNENFYATANIKDPNIHLALVANGNMGGAYPSIEIDADIDSIKTLPLNFTPDAMYYRGKIQASFPQLNPDALTGKLFVTQSLLVANGQRVPIDTLSLIANHTNGLQYISLQSDFINARLDGTYKLTQLGTIIQSTIQPYFAIAPAGTSFKTDPYDLNVNLTVVDHPTLRAFVPTLTRLDPVTLVGNFSNVGGMKATLNAPAITLGANNISGVAMNAYTEGNALRIVTTLDQFNNGPSMVMYNTSLDAALANNQLNFGLAIKDRAARDKYRLNGTLAQENSTTYTFSLAPDSLMLNYAPWTASQGNYIRYTGKDIFANNFTLSQANQQLSINSLAASSNSPLQVSLANFHIATLTGFVQTDSLLVDGTVNGNVILKNVLTQPAFTTDLNINNLAFKGDTLGDVTAKINNNTQNVFATDVRITGRGNDVALTGNYYLKPANQSSMDFDLDIRQLPFKTIEAVSMGMLDRSSGNLTGKVAIDGTIASPNIDGNINFDNTAFNVVMLGSYFKIDDEAIKVNNEGISFDRFTIRDSIDNTLVLDGIARTNNFMNYRFDMNVRARNFRAMNSAKAPGSLYYGQVYLTSNLGIKGTEVSPIVDGSLTINEDTKLTVVLPQSEPGVVDREGVIKFVDMDMPGIDSFFQQTVAKYDSSFNKSAITGMDVTVNVEVVKEAEFNVIVDEGNGDFLQVKGEALLNAGIDPSGKTTLVGTYELESGGYELSFNFIRRRFDIVKGSKLTFTGEPTDALVDVTAIYVANASSMELVGQQSGDVVRAASYQQKLPYQVKLMMDGELMQPTLTFDIALPEETNSLRADPEVITTVNTRLDQLRAEPSELNKQVFALLLLNRFISENPFESSGGGFNAEMYARQSVSKILTQQLNDLTSDLIAGVDISFDLNTSEDYRTGSAQTRTDFNVAVSKRLLNDRLKVTVGNNFEMQGAQRTSGNGPSGIIGNLAVDYQLTPDGRYLVRAYRRNEDEGVVEGYVVETGLKFIVSVEYNRFKEIFEQRRRRRVVKKEERAERREARDSTSTDSTSVKSSTTMTGENLPNNTLPAGDSISINKQIADDRKMIPALSQSNNR